MSWSAADCTALASSFANELGPRWQHLEAVGRAAQRLPLEVREADLVVGAAWLHDIGYVPALQRSGMHAVDGALYLNLMGAPARLVSLVAYHTGAAFEAEERGMTGQLLQFAPPPEPMLDALTYVDLTTDLTGQAVTVEQRLDGIFSRYEPQHPVHRAVTRSRPYLEASAGRAAARLGQPT